MPKVRRARKSRKRGGSVGPFIVDPVTGRYRANPNFGPISQSGMGVKPKSRSRKRKGGMLPIPILGPILSAFGIG